MNAEAAILTNQLLQFSMTPNEPPSESPTPNDSPQPQPPQKPRVQETIRLLATPQGFRLLGQERIRRIVRAALGQAPPKKLQFEISFKKQPRQLEFQALRDGGVQRVANIKNITCIHLRVLLQNDQLPESLEEKEIEALILTSAATSTGNVPLPACRGEMSTFDAFDNDPKIQAAFREAEKLRMPVRHPQSATPAPSPSHQEAGPTDPQAVEEALFALLQEEAKTEQHEQRKGFALLLTHAIQKKQKEGEPPPVVIALVKALSNDHNNIALRRATVLFLETLTRGARETPECKKLIATCRPTVERLLVPFRVDYR